MLIIKFLSGYGPYGKDDIAGLEDSIARDLINAGKAVEYKPRKAEEDKPPLRKPTLSLNKQMDSDELKSKYVTK